MSDWVLVNSRNCGFWITNIVPRSMAEHARDGCIKSVLRASLAVRQRSLRLTALQPSEVTLGFVLASTVTALLSSALLYVSYRPYAKILQRFIRTGDKSQLPAVSEFLAYAQIPLGTGRNLGWGLSAQEVTFYFWFLVAGLCVLTLLLAVWRFWRRPRGSART